MHLICNCHVTAGGGREWTEHIKALRASTSQPLPPPAPPTPTPPSACLTNSCYSVAFGTRFLSARSARNAETESDPIFCFCILLLLHVQWVKHLAGIVPSSPVRARSAPLPCTPHPSLLTRSLLWNERPSGLKESISLYYSLYNAKNMLPGQLKWNGFHSNGLPLRIAKLWQVGNMLPQHAVLLLCCHTAATPPYLTRRSRKAFNDFR